MIYSACLNPIRVYNKYTDSYVLTPCRKCDACLATSNLSKVARLKETRLQWQDCIFFTLTYNNDYVPVAQYTDNFIFHPIDKIGGKKYSNYERLGKNFERRTNNFLLSREDVKHFMAAFRNAYPDTVLFVAGEYGPTTFRPHYHGLVFFNARGIERKYQIDEISNWISVCWSSKLRSWLSSYNKRPYKSLGFVRTRYDNECSAAYTAQYTNCLSDVPSVIKRLASPFQLFTRNLSQVYLPTSDEFRELLYFGSVVQMPQYVPTQFKTKRFANFTLLPLGIIYRYFPKFTGNRRISLSGFCSLVNEISFCSYEQWREIVYFQPFAYNGSVLRRLFKVKTVDVLEDTQLQPFYYAFRSICKIIRCYYHGDVGFYYNIYSSVFSNVELFKLKQFYELQQQIADDFSVDSRYINGLYVSFPDESYLPFPDASSKWFDLDNNPLVAPYARLMKKLCLDNTKTKKRNDYLNLI